ncbi:PREDICTED: COBRA-like protein 11 [Tarenaya hassleriana]|uniref:COBRA-like protein 11 n=1 Tax=Tarenaya hassleriana TaxID=28532 RepID=UPI00053C6F55|nr:PREDICTED: COBRA-like protein 11 [Tarenaya hassleriana]
MMKTTISLFFLFPASQETREKSIKMMKTRSETDTETHRHRVKFVLALTIALVFPTLSLSQDYNEERPPGLVDCDGVYMSYRFGSREREYPRVKNVTAQSWAFKSTAIIVNTGTEEIKGWQMFIGFQHRELIVSATGSVSADGEFPYDASNGTTFIGSPNTDLKTSIETAGDYAQISADIEITGTMFGLKANVMPMPKTIKLTNDGWECPTPNSKEGTMQVCCKKNPKFKDRTNAKTKFMPRQYGDLNIVYDVLQAYPNNYLAQVTIDNDNPLGRLDHWNLTWEWMRGEFIYSLRGAYTDEKDPADCLNSKAGEYYQDLDFSQVANCQKKPTIKDLPVDRKDDNLIGKLPFCCKNGTLLPSIMDPSKARSIFQLQVYKLPPDLNRTEFYPPQGWKIDGFVNPQYKCGPPVRVDGSAFPDPNGLQATSFAVASWQVICNITRPKPRASRCCVSFSAFYNQSAIPCNTCACGCDDIDTDTCDSQARPMLLPPDSLLVPFTNRTLKAKAWAKQRHFPIPKKLPCPDNCGISINWHLNSDYSNGWTASVTVFNWGDNSVEDWFVAVDLGRSGEGYEKVYSFNGTRIPPKNQTILFQGLPGLNYLIRLTNGSNPLKDPRVPGKMQSVISFRKKDIKSLNIRGGDGFPKRVFFNGEECELPKHLPKSSGERFLPAATFLRSALTVTVSFLAITDRHLSL